MLAVVLLFGYGYYLFNSDAKTFQLALQVLFSFFNKINYTEDLSQFYSLIRYSAIEDSHPDLIVGSTDKQPLLETLGEVQLALYLWIIIYLQSLCT